MATMACPAFSFYYTLYRGEAGPVIFHLYGPTIITDVGEQSLLGRECGPSRVSLLNFFKTLDLAASALKSTNC